MKRSNELVKAKDLAKLTNMNKFFGGEMLVKFLMQILKLNKINDVYSSNADKIGFQFVDALIDELNISFEVNPDDLKRIPKTGPFITVSNHPFGGLDGILLLKVLGEIRPDYKVLANFMLQSIEPLKEHFFGVNPFEDFKDSKSSVAGIKQALKHVSEGGALGIFPAGEVSTYQNDVKKVCDKLWEPSAIKMIRKMDVPIIPVYFHGQNSSIFHFLGKVHPLLRTAKLPSEMFNKGKKPIKIRIGQSISVKDQKEFEKNSDFGLFLRARTYALGTKVEVKHFFQPQPVKQKKIIEPIDPAVLDQEIQGINESFCLFKHEEYKVFCAPSEEIPNTLREIGRLREITFREVGEGTNKELDLDKYDVYYRHLVIWDENAKKVVGAYRVCKGKTALEQYDIKGFYLNSLFKLEEGLRPVLEESIELGRSFIVKEYQRKPLSLFLLWKGIFYYLLKNTDYRYLIGPVSISKDFSKFSQSLLVEFIRKHYYAPEYAQFVKPRKKFRVPKNPEVDRNLLVKKMEKDINRLDRFIKDIEFGFGAPVLLKKYLKLNGKIIGFNIDPDFNDSLDGLVLVDIYDIDPDFIKTLAKEINDPSILERFNTPR